jgi:hypothetical protein
MILELEKGFGALIHVSPEPMRHAVAELQYSKRTDDPHLQTAESHPDSGDNVHEGVLAVHR